MRTTIIASLALLVGCAGSTPNDGNTPPGTEDDTVPTEDDGNADRFLPSLQPVDGDCEVPDVLPVEISLSDWIAASNDIIEGTIVEVRAAWEPLASAEGFLTDASECDSASIGVDLVLSDVVSRRGGSPSEALTVRLGAGTFSAWGVSATADPGDTVVTWGGTPTLAAGMRIGGAIYSHVHVDHPVFMSGFREPLYEVIADRAYFQQVDGASECQWPSPHVDPLDGVTTADLEAALTAAATGTAPLASDYRDWLRVDDTSFSRGVSYTYTSFCTDVAEPEPNDQTEPDDDVPVVPPNPSLPAIESVTGDCEPLDLTIDVPLPDWVAAADDIIDGTIVEVRAAWDPLASSGGFLADWSECNAASVGVDLVLTDVVSRRGGSPASDLTVRLGAATFGTWGLHISAVPGAIDVSWDWGSPALTPGMRIGGAIYDHVHVEHPVFMSGFREPLYEVIGDHAYFQQIVGVSECQWPAPLVAPLSGLSLADLEAALVAAAAEAAGPVATEYRDWLRVDNSAFSKNISFTYTTYCSSVASP